MSSHLLVTSLLVLVSSSYQVVVAQDLHIYYNAFTDSTYYLQNGVSLNQPTVRKGSNVILHIENYNNYLYNVKVKSQNGNSSMANGNPIDLNGLKGGGGGSPLGLLFGGGSPLGGMTSLLNLSTGPGSGFAGNDRDLSSDALAETRSAFNLAVQRADARAEKIEAVQEKVQQMLEAQQIQAFAAQEIKRLRFNPSLSPQQIKQFTQEYISRIFGKVDPKQIDLPTVIEKSNAQAGFSALTSDYEANVSKYREEVAQMSRMLLQFDLLEDSQSEKLASLKQEANEVVAAATDNLSSYQENVQSLETKVASMQSLDTQALTELRIDYLVTMENDFSKTFRYPATSDELNLQLTFTPIDSVGIPNLTSRTVPPIAVKVFGGLQINASLGLSFGQFFERPETFYVRDSTIRSSEQDAFSPILTSFVHFYPQSRKETSVGGSFGVGIPLGGSGGGSLDAITFFLGPSLIMGRQQRFVLSAGLIGGKVDQLTSGYQVGDPFDFQPDLLQTEAVYKLGYAVGLSFNLASRN
ncbi:MAG: hypothetical protein DA408_08330 [Bacteroidetes bacterium]|nr:MAG: hypothetical protein C7N36_05650 [Bacteroidota bacterium]PTM12960.1 MAG: hypothetical protein DA408_08330 [Bacteroidota bacterium]